MKRNVIALGFFDGVHLGHGALLTACRNMAERLQASAVCLTFDVHPDALVFGTSPRLINTGEDRKMLMRTLYRMDEVLELPFDRATLDTPWQDFFRQLLETYHAVGLVCGQDFRFGKGGKGTAQLLQDAAREAGIACTVVPEQQIDGITVSSTYIRELIQAGDMVRAAQFLGHPHILSGTVIPGQQLGRTLGIPTANISLPDTLQVPRLGVYACRVFVDETPHLAVTNVGSRPTVDGKGLLVEPWILDFSGNLYGKTVTVEFGTFLRPEKKFPDLTSLQSEIRRNAQQARAFYADQESRSSSRG